MNLPAHLLPVEPEAARYRYFTCDQGIGLVANGRTPEQTLELAAEALFALTGDLSHLRPERTFPVSFIESDHSRAFARWLNLLIELAREQAVVFCEFHLQRRNSLWWGCATGQARDDRSARRPGPKRVRYDRVSLGCTERGWEATCTIEDVPGISGTASGQPQAA